MKTIKVRRQIVVTEEHKVIVPLGMSDQYLADSLLDTNSSCCELVVGKGIMSINPFNSKVISTTVEDEDGNVLGKWVANTGK